MITCAPLKIELEEFTPVLKSADTISYGAAEILWKNYGTQVSVDYPSPKTDGCWRLTSNGWVGYIPLTEDLALSLLPKVELRNIFGMLEYAYRLKSFRFLSELFECKSLEEFYEHLANILAHRVLDRGRKGFYRAYLQRSEDLPYLRGRLDLRRRVGRPWEIRLGCLYEEHTADVEDNQILTWTMSQIARSGMCAERARPSVRTAYRVLSGLTSLVPCGPESCSGRQYNRLNDDYSQLHALCRFFLDQTGPSHEIGSARMLPFLVDMSRLYELFVAEWLRTHLPVELMMRSQEQVMFGQNGALGFRIDLMLYDAHTGKARYVLDTKYKTSATPSPTDVAQVIAYAEAKGCQEAVLVYPSSSIDRMDERIGSKRLRTLPFSIEGDLEEAGKKFVEMLLN